MRKIIALFIVALLSLAVPVRAEFIPAPGAEATLDYSSNRVTGVINSLANFAGKYKIEETGCGTNCLNLIIINLETGKTFEGGLSGPNFHGGLEYSPDSKILITNWYEKHAYDSMKAGSIGEQYQYYWRWEDENLIFLGYESWDNSLALEAEGDRLEYLNRLESQEAEE